MSSKKKDFSPNTKLKVNSKVNIPDLLSVALLNLSQPDFESLTVEATGSAICRAVDLSEAIKQSKPKVGYKVVIKSIKHQKNNYISYSKKRSIISLIQIIFSGERIPKKILKKKQKKKEKVNQSSENEEDEENEDSNETNKEDELNSGDSNDQEDQSSESETNKTSQREKKKKKKKKIVVNEFINKKKKFVSSYQQTRGRGFGRGRRVASGRGRGRGFGGGYNRGFNRGRGRNYNSYQQNQYYYGSSTNNEGYNNYNDFNTERRHYNYPFWQQQEEEYYY
ncbi:la-related protein [Anaeramoeba flamelloides]|uniref:La-related protein n=1 Tax=Anaeramoeba flamelloides TaxID=1746091 RepID=A0ABQ8YSX0_9EUKA|nr:la-related protein [Anaeramoeba flamelloides]